MNQSGTRTKRRGTERTALYRIWGDAGLLLYIGISNSFGRRWREHAKRQPWWDEMRRLTADEWFDHREDAEAAERTAIKAERPKYNKTHAVPAVLAAQPRAQKRRPSGAGAAGAPKPFRDCNCRDPQTRELLHRKCPRLAEQSHGGWYVRYTVPEGASDWDPARKRTQRQLGPFASRREAAGELAKVLHGYAGSGLRVAHLPARPRTVAAA